jgi:hypothetical protein
MRLKTLACVMMVALSLTGCSSLAGGSGDELVTSNVDRSTVPGFVSEKQVERDVIDGFDVTELGIDPATTRYQGEWDGQDVYLGITGGSAVQVVTVSLDNPEEWWSGTSVGNSVLGLGDPVTLQYLPQGTEVVPDGWRAMSGWMMIRD